MACLTIRHITTYRYRRPVAFGEHRLMLRPRDTGAQKVKAARLAITPLPESLDFIEDIFGNQIGVARFSTRATELRFESIVDVEHSPQAHLSFDDAPTGTFPVAYDETEWTELQPYTDRHYPDPDNAVGIWASRLLPPAASIGNFELLVAMTLGIRDEFRYQRREAKGIQTPQETLLLGEGSCRDFAVLMVEAARSLGFAARFASGYLAVATENPAGGATHAWAQVSLPGVGWIDFDPTSGTAESARLVTVAVVRDPQDALPLHGTYFGGATDHVGMDVHVHVINDASEISEKKNA
jgi:transglutaminase-like putative cysteine protease